MLREKRDVIARLPSAACVAVALQLLSTVVATMAFSPIPSLSPVRAGLQASPVCMQPRVVARGPAGPRAASRPISEPLFAARRKVLEVSAWGMWGLLPGSSAAFGLDSFTKSATDRNSWKQKAEKVEHCILASTVPLQKARRFRCQIRS